MNRSRETGGGMHATSTTGGLHLSSPRPNATRKSSHPKLRSGEQFGRYIIGPCLGQGGMGIVHEAYDSLLARPVALKVMKPSDQKNRQVVSERAHAEAQALRRIEHGNVVTLYDVGQYADCYYLAMEMVDGQTIKQWVRTHQPSWQQVLACFIQAGLGLTAVHRADVVHRDFKPSNVMLGRRGQIRLLDFGLATRMGDRDRADTPTSDEHVADGVTQTGMAIGTPPYMSPEQHAGRAVDTRSDQFSFCVALYEALFRVRPFVGTIAQLLEAKANSRFTPVPPDSDVPRAVRRIVERGLCRKPADRWPDMMTLLARLTDRLHHRDESGLLAVPFASPVQDTRVIGL